MASQISISNVYAGQMLWTFCSPRPYWPSIVCASDSGEITKNLRKQFVYVKYCGNRKNHWVQLDNVFEFNGYESYLVKKRQMKAILSDDEFEKAFGTTNNVDWREAVVVAEFVFHKDVDLRLDAINTLNEINFQLGKIASSINFDDATAKPTQQKRQSRRSLPPPATDNTEHRGTNRRSLSVKKASHQKPNETFEKALSEYQIHSFPDAILFDGIPCRNICKICCSLDDGSDANLVECSACGDHVHKACLTNNNHNDDSFVQLPGLLDFNDKKKRSSIRIRLVAKLLCDECQKPPSCFSCKEVNATAAQLKRCDVKSCGRYYHIDCVDNLKQTEFVDSKFKCPLHVCHTCFSTKNDPITQRTKKFTFCVKCPTAYHLQSRCIPAGTFMLSQQRHICIRHRCEPRRNLPTLDWCVRCGEEGDALICCGSCPKTYHMSCLDSSEIPDPFLCESCVNGRHPLYGDLVVVKSGDHPWWPAVIVPPFKVPATMVCKPRKDHQFCVQFFGDYRFGWTGRSFVHFLAKNEASKFLSDNAQQTAAISEVNNWFDKIDRMQSENNNNNNDDNNNNNNIKNKNCDSNKSLLHDALPKTRQIPKYIKITTMNVVPPARLTKTPDGPCKCSCSTVDPCGPTSTCENRELSIECAGKQCPHGSLCMNQCFDRKKYAAVQVMFVDEKKGFGLIAAEHIKAGTLIIEYVGDLITHDELERRKAKKESTAGPKHFYFMTYGKGLYIDAERKGNESRFINHSCNPNCQIQKWIVQKVVRIGYFALKDIEKGTEITTNYGFGRGKVHKCYCGEKNCEGVIGRTSETGK